MSQVKEATVSYGAKLYPGGIMRVAEVLSRRIAYGIAIAASALLATACSREADAARITPEYDKKTGKLTLLKYDSNGNGKVDTWSYMDGARVVRIEIDKDENGSIDRWEYYGVSGTLEKIGFSRANDGKQDAWSFPGADGSIERIERSTRRDGKVSRIEHFAKDVIVAAEEDTDGDGRMDKWETYDGARLTSVAFDTRGRGTPDRRLTYNADGSVRVEIDRAGTGQFAAGDNTPRAASRK